MQFFQSIFLTLVNIFFRRNGQSSVVGMTTRSWDIFFRYHIYSFHLYIFFFNFLMYNLQSMHMIFLNLFNSFVNIFFFAVMDNHNNQYLRWFIKTCDIFFRYPHVYFSLYRSFIFWCTIYKVCVRFFSSTFLTLLSIFFFAVIDNHNNQYSVWFIKTIVWYFLSLSWRIFLSHLSFFYTFFRYRDVYFSSHLSFFYFPMYNRFNFFVNNFFLGRDGQS